MRNIELNKKKILQIIGNILTIGSIIGIFYLILKLDVEIKVLITKQNVLLMLGLGIFLSSVVLINSIAWRALLSMLTNKTVKLHEVVNIYARSNINKYLPGNIMHYATRNILGAQYDIDQKSILTATIFEIVFKILCAALIVFIFVRNELKIALEYLGINNIILYLFLFLAFIILIIYIYIFSKRNNVSIKKNIKYVLIANSLYILAFIINAVVFITITITFNNRQMFLNEILLSSGIYILAWLIGYLTPGSPGGLGIRESLMILLLGSIYDYNLVITISIGVRIVTIFADVLAYISNLIYNKRGKNETNNTDTML